MMSNPKTDSNEIPILLNAEQASRYSDEVLGGKANQMAWLSRHQFPVPEWIVVTTSAFNTFLHDNGFHDWVNAQLANLSAENVAAQSLSIREKIESGNLSKAFIGALQNRIEGMPGGGVDQFFAVRSSVVGEDSANASFAGQMDSFLFQKGMEAISQSIIQVFASAFTERALIYRMNHGIDLLNIRAAVIVQRMVEGDISGVMFTAHPINGHLDQGLISACYGIGEGIVSGLCTTDEYTLDHDGHHLSKVINDKDIQLVFNKDLGRGTKEQPVAEESRHRSVLTDEQVRQLMRLGVQVAEQRGFPQDIEWTIKDQKIYLLQTRPVTSLPAPEQAKGDQIVWDNSNIQESYCGVTTPLTFSFANRAYATVYEQTMRLMGISDKRIQSNRSMLDNMLGLIKGRVYYNINNWYRGLLFLPSFGTNKASMERMMGLQDPVDLIQDTHLSLWEKMCRLPEMLRSLITMLYQFATLSKRVDRFRTMFETAYRAIPRNSLHTLEMAELMGLAKQLDEQLLNRWTTPIVNDFYVMIFNGKVNKWLTESGVEQPELVQNNLMSGEEGIESTEPTKMLLSMCADIRKSPALIQCFDETENHQLLETLQQTDPAFHRRCLEYIERYGDRTIGELKLESITLRKDPSFMFAVLKNFLTRPDLTLDTLNKNEHQFREEAEKEAFSKIIRHFGEKKLPKFKKALSHLREGVKHRENMRLARTRMFGLYRDIYMELGKQLALYGLLNEPRDILYITVEELDAYMEGRSVTAFKDLAELRKKEFAEYEAQELPHHFSTWGPVYHHNEYAYQGMYADLSESETSGDLSGIGCYPGVVEQPVRLIFSPDDEMSLNGQILCTVRTDPGWAPLFPTAGGLLVERGSTLSHSAVVARELGIPAVVNIPGITKILKDGERVRMDGGKGTVQRLDVKTDLNKFNEEVHDAS
jgi:pyruvate,water dikinase